MCAGLHWANCEGVCKCALCVLDRLSERIVPPDDSLNAHNLTFGGENSAHGSSGVAGRGNACANDEATFSLWTLLVCACAWVGSVFLSCFYQATSFSLVLPLSHFVILSAFL